MAIYRLLRSAPLGPDDISRLVVAYEQTLKALRLKHRSDPMTRFVARRIIEIAQTGVGDPLQLAKMAINELGPASSEEV
jgi:hypothetical protein